MYRVVLSLVCLLLLLPAGVPAQIISSGGGSVPFTDANCPANQVATGITSLGGLVCSALTSTYTDNSIAHTGIDINASHQVTATHLAAPLPFVQGGHGLNSGASGGLLFFNSSTSLASSNMLPLLDPLLGGGVGGAPTAGTRTGDSTLFATASGTASPGTQLAYDANGNILASVFPVGTPTQAGLSWNVATNLCTSDAQGGKLTINGALQIVCAADVGGGGGGGGGSITAVGSCFGPQCFTSGSPSESLTFNNSAALGTITLATVGGNLGLQVLNLPAESGTLCSTGSICSGYTAQAVTLSIGGTNNQLQVTPSTPQNLSASRVWTISIPTNPTLPGITSGTFNGPLQGNATTASALVNDPAPCLAGEFVTDWGPTGTITCTTPANATLTTKGIASFPANTFLVTAGVVTLDYVNAQKATGSLSGFLAAGDFAAFAAKIGPTRNLATTAPLSGGGDLSADRTLTCPTCTTNAAALTTDLPVLGAGGNNTTKIGSRSGSTTTFATVIGVLTQTKQLAFDANGNIVASLVDIGSSVDATTTTKGSASFAANTFLVTAGAVSIDWANIQKATGSQHGALSSTDWTTFSGKVGPTRSISTTAPLSGGGDLSADRTLTCPTCTTNAAALPANLPVLGAGGNATAVGARSGSTTTFATVMGALTQSKQLAFDPSGNIVASANDTGTPTQTGLTWNTTVATCTGDVPNNGKLTVNASNQIICAADVSGNVSTNIGSSTPQELAVFADTTGKLLTHATLTAPVLKATAGVLGAASAGSDYVIPTGNVATASALLTTPTPCATDKFATSIAANGDLTCTFVATTQLTGTISAAQLANTAVTPGTCTSCNLTIDAQGRVTLKSSGGGSSVIVTEIDGAPSVGVGTIKFSNSTVTDNGDGSVTVVTGAGGGGDASTNLGAGQSAIGEVTVFATTGGKTLTHSTLTATVVKATAGVLSAASAGSDYVVPGGTVQTAITLANDPTACGAGLFVTDWGPTGTITCTAIADATTTTKGIASFTANTFLVTTGAVTIDWANIQKATTSQHGALSSTDWNTFNAKVSTTRSISTTAPLGGGGDLSANRTFTCATCTTNAAALTANLPVLGAGGNATAIGARSGTTTTFGTVTGTLTQSKQLAFDANGNIVASASDLYTAADATTTTKGIASFPANTFLVTAGVVTLDYVNAQKATGSVSGFLLNTDFATFAAKVAPTRSIGTTAPLGGGGDLSADRTLTCTTCTTNAAALTTDLPVLGAAGNNTTKTGARSGSTTTFATVTGLLTQSKQLMFDASGNVIVSTSDIGTPTQTGLTWNVVAATCTGDTNSGKLTVNGSNQIVCAADASGSGATGNLISDITTSAIGEVVLYATTDGRHTTHSTLTAPVVKVTAGVLSAASAGSDYVVPTGTVQTASAFVSIPQPCPAGQYATTIAANGNLGCAAVAFGQLSGVPIAATDGTKGIVTLNVSDFSCVTGACAINYLTAQKATGVVSGFLLNTDFANFTAKVSPTRNIGTTAPLAGGGTLAGDLSLTCPTCTTNAAVLTTDLPVLGAGSNNTTKAGARSGTTTTFGTVTGTLTQSRQLAFDATGNIIASASPIGTPTQAGLAWNVVVGTCTGDVPNNGKLTVNASNQIICAADVSGGSASGNLISDALSSVDGEVMLYAGATGLHAKRSALTATIVKSDNGILSAAIAGTHYVTPGGTVQTAITLANDPAPCSAGDFVTDWGPTGTIICTTPANATLTTKGIASFATNTFIATAGAITIDWTNIQKATGSQHGALSSGDWTIFNTKVSLIGAEVLTNKKIVPRSVQLSVATGTPTAANADVGGGDRYFRYNVTGALTISPPTGTPSDGQLLKYEYRDSTAVSHTITYSTAANGFQANTLLLPTATTGDGVTIDAHLFQWNATLSKWLILANNQTTGTIPVAALEPLAQATLVGRPAGAGTGAPQILSAATARAVLGLRGSIPLNVNSAKLPATLSAIVDNGEKWPKLIFDGATAWCASWISTMPLDYVGSPSFQYVYSRKSGTAAGSVFFDVAVMVLSDSGADPETDSYDTANTCNDATVPLTAGPTKTITCALTTNDTMAAGKMFTVRMCRNMTDTTAEQIEVLGALLTYTK